MADTSIRVTKELKDRLDLFKAEDESYEDVIRRLTERDKWAGFGALSESESGTREGMETMRKAMRNGTEEDIGK